MASNTVEWANIYSDFKLVEACAAEAHQHFLSSTEDAHSWEPITCTIRDILKMPDRVVKRAWISFVKKELKILVDAHTFMFDTLSERDISVPVMEIFEVKINSHGSLDKLKTHLVV
jgi:hypothetical protein